MKTILCEKYREALADVVASKDHEDAVAIAEVALTPPTPEERGERALLLDVHHV